MPGKRAVEFQKLLTQFRKELGLTKSEMIDYFSVSSEVPSHVRNKAKRILQREARKEARNSSF